MAQQRIYGEGEGSATIMTAQERGWMLTSTIPPSTTHPPRLLLLNSQNGCLATKTPDLLCSDTTCKILQPTELLHISKTISVGKHRFYGEGSGSTTIMTA